MYTVLCSSHEYAVYCMYCDHLCVCCVGYFFSNDYKQVWRVAEAMQSGLVGVNEGIISAEVAPFSGWKESGSESMYMYTFH